MIFDEFDQIHADEEMKSSTLHKVMEKQKQRRRRMHGFMSLGTVCACILLFLAVFQPWQTTPSTKPVAVSKEVYSYVTLDINPSMEWKLNEKQTIVDVRFYNKDAQRLSDKIKVKGLPLEEALQKLMNNEDFQSYLDTGFLEVSVYSPDTKTSLTLEEELNSYLSEHMNSDNYHCSHLDEETHHNARQHHVSGGRYRVIEEIMNYDSSYSVKELEKYSMRELYDILAKYTNTTEEPSMGKDCHGRGHHGHNR